MEILVAPIYNKILDTGPDGSENDFNPSFTGFQDELPTLVIKCNLSAAVGLDMLI